MGDPLSLLRQYNINKREIVERENQIIFGEFSWPKTVETTYLQYGYKLKAKRRHYYTLECLLYFLKNVTLEHWEYERKCVLEGIPFVIRRDRRELIAYLSGDSVTCASIDKSATQEISTQVKQAVKGKLMQNLPVQRKKYLEKVAEKLLVNKQTKLKQTDKASSSQSSILQSSDKVFSTEVFSMLKNVKASEKARLQPPKQRMNILPEPTLFIEPHGMLKYNRYQQELYDRQMIDKEGFKIDTKGTFHREKWFEILPQLDDCRLKLWGQYAPQSYGTRN